MEMERGGQRESKTFSYVNNTMYVSKISLKEISG